MKVTLIDTMGNDMRVADAARVSFDKKASEYTPEQNEKLINYLAKHKHYSPFGHCFASFHVKAPIFVRAQLVKHEYLRMNEVSRRYVDTPPEFYRPPWFRMKAKDKKQGSSSETTGVGISRYNTEIDKCLELYEDLIKAGVAPEQARMALPQSMYTEWYWSGSLDAFANMVNLRDKPDAQEETRFIAKEISNLVLDKFPISWKALTDGS